MYFSKSLVALALAITGEAVAIAIPVENTLDVSAPSELFKRDGISYLDVYGSGGSRHAEGDPKSPLQVSVSCGTVKVFNIDGYSGLCSAQLAGGFSGCEGCEYTGHFERYSLTVSMKCGNAHILVGAGSDSAGGGEIGENINVRDCNGKAGGGTKTMNICAGSNWTLFRC
ncbi:hypothetical protein BKA64DRAFT_710158 [Cadophora sp. MPI-SDFR-AT-0126]|nr:hypothetical protein BKA64DRAFT_710158 [Leotiomycetes sp. MPI-SDFR-AT-0126]